MSLLEKYHNDDFWNNHRSGSEISFKTKLGSRVLPAAVGIVSVTRLWQDTIGHVISQEDWNKSEQESNLLKSQSEAIAQRLEDQGIPAKTDTKTAVIGICTGVVETVKQYRNTNLIPVMQSRNIHDISRHVKYFADHTNKKKLRMLVVSNGWVGLNDYRDEHKKFTRLISRFSAHENVKNHGVELVYYNIENTIKRNNEDGPELNMHSHILIKSTMRHGPKKWAEFMAWCRTQFPKGYVHDEKIRNVQECVKYVFKPAEFNALSGSELAELFNQTFKLKFFHPLGEIRTFRRELEEAKLKLVKVPPKDVTEASGEEETDWQWCIMEKAKAKPRESSDEPSGDVDNVLMAITNPSPKFSNQFEPCLVVHNFDGDIDALIKQEGIEDIICKAREIWAARSASMRHTTTTTVRKSRKKIHQKQPISPKEEFNRKIPPTDQQNRQENQIWQ